MSYMTEYKFWLTSDLIDDETKEELRSIEDEKEIEDRFYKSLSFGTAGLRGKLGAGTNRMNKYTVDLAMKGLSKTILEDESKDRGILIAYDVRHGSEEFARSAAEIFAKDGIKTYIFDGIRSTPMVSYAIRELNTLSGIMITASHNPKDYNGIKVYWEDGSQILDPIGDRIIENINSIENRYSIDKMDFQEGLSKGLIEYISKDIDEKYDQGILDLAIRDDIKKDIKIVYTPLNGTGSIPVRRILEKRGFTRVYTVEEQKNPDPDFKTVGYPNPEFEEAFDLSIKLGEEVGADILIATDPDADRVSAMVKKDGSYKLINGNQMGGLLVNYILSQRSGNKTLPKDGAIVKSIVTGDISKEIADRYEIDIYETLTGFKNICGKGNQLEKSGKNTFIFGFEESIGYVYGTMVGDKDGINTSMLISEMAAYYLGQGKTLWDVLEDIYSEYGYFKDKLISLELDGIAGKEKITSIMDDFRASPLGSIANNKLVKKIDYLYEETGNPKSNVLKYYYEGNMWFAVRPSGTEPKLKVYLYTNDKENEASLEKLRLMEEAIRLKMDL